MPADFWERYEPDNKQPWSLERVVHLHRRAAFAATWDELQRDLADGPDQAVRRLLEGSSNLHAPREFDTIARLLTDTAASQAEIGRLQAAWFYRNLFSPDPLLEKLTLLWHDHFATANSKVADVGLMRRQNDTLRKHARGKFVALLNASLREPALLLYLDAQANRKEHPNENLARELMELFTLGAGHYSEADVKEAARALTGWSVEDGQFVVVAQRHDGGQKSILGRTATFDAPALIEWLLKQPAVADRIVKKLIRLFFSEAGVSAEAATQLARGLRERELDVAWAIETILRSKRFFDSSNIRARVLGPVEFVVGSARLLDLFEQAPSTLAMADWSARMGQDLFEPPNVGGWPGGRAWAHSRSMIARANYVAALVSGPDIGRSSPYEPIAQAAKYGFGMKPSDLLVFHYRLRFGTDPTEEAKQRYEPLAPTRMVTAILSSPEAQIG